MRNLKRVLSTIMAVAMLMGLVVFSTSATSFSDDKEIVHKEAVDMAIALNIINGYDDGSFKPTGTITRAEMAKMISFVMNGGSEPVMPTTTVPTFTDIGGNAAWAQKYIEYCVAEGILAGYGDGTFKPSNSVTGTEAAKMLLVALGYRAEVEGFNGPSWALKIGVRATDKKLFDGLKGIDPNTALTRDNAARMIWNALQAGVVEYESELQSVNGQLVSVLIAKPVLVASTDDALTLLAKRYSQDEQIGTLTDITWSESDKAYRYTVDFTDKDKNDDDMTFVSATDYSNLFGMQVKAVYKTNERKNTLYGMVAHESSVLASGIIGDFDSATKGGDSSVKFDGTKYTLDTGKLEDLPAYAFNQNTGTFEDLLIATGDDAGKIKADVKHFTVKLIDNDNDDKLDTVVYLPVAVAEVSAVNTKNVILTNVLDTENVLDNTKTFEKEDQELYSGIEKGDFVIVYAEENRTHEGNEFVEMDSFEGKVSGTKSGEVRVDNTWYDLCLVGKDTKTPTSGSEYTFFAIGSYIFYTDVVSEASLDNVAYVSAAAIGEKLGNDQAKLFFTDGTSSVVNVADVKDDDTVETLAGRLVTYTVKNGEYTLRAAKEANFGSVEFDESAVAEITAATSKLTSKLVYTGGANYVFADDAVVFIHYNDGTDDKVKVITGKQAKDLDESGNLDVAFNGESEVLFDTVGNMKTAKVASIMNPELDLPSGLGDSGNYGYVTGIATSRDADDEDVFEITLWTAGGEKVVYADTNELDEKVILVGTVIEYTDLGDKEVEDVVIATGHIDGKAALTGIYGDEYTITVNGVDATYAVTDDTEIIYVNTEDEEGEDGGTIVTADEDEDDNLIDNVYFAADKDNELLVLVVDTNNAYEEPSDK